MYDRFFAKSLMKLFIYFFAAIFLIFAAGRASADFDQMKWQYRSKILGGSLSESDFVILEIPSDFFSRLTSDLRDLRIINDDGEVPYVAAAEKEIESFGYISSKIFNLSSLQGESTSFIVDTGSSGTFHNSITIATKSENFRRIVEIQGSNDQNSWRTLNSRGQIFDYTVRDIKPVTVRDTAVFYPDSTFRYLFVKIFDQGEDPLSIQGARIARKISIPAHEISYTPNLEILEDSRHQATDVILDLGTRGVPHRRGRVTTSSVNFERAVAIYDSDDKKDWRLLTHAYIFVINTPQFQGSNQEFSYPESNKRYLKFSILNRDDRPITIGGVTLSGVVRRILFNFEPSKTYFVYLSNSDSRRPQYDIEKISQYVEVSTLNRVSTSPIESNPSYVPVDPPKPPFTERSPYVLPVVLGMAVAILAFLLLRIVVRVRSGS